MQDPISAEIDRLLARFQREGKNQNIKEWRQQIEDDAAQKALRPPQTIKAEQAVEDFRCALLARTEFSESAITLLKDISRHDWIPYIKPDYSAETIIRLLPRVTVADRIQATIRHSGYWKDLETFLKRTEKAKSLDSDTVPSFWEPHSSLADRWNLPATIINKQQADKLLKYYRHRPWRSSEPIRVIDIQPRCVLLSIDLSETANRLHDVFDTLVNQYQKEYGWAETRRNRPFQCDPFEVYDLVEKNHLNISQAAQKAFRKTFARGQGPAYSSEAKRMYGQANRAYQWVKKIITQVGQQAGH